MPSPVGLTVSLFALHLIGLTNGIFGELVEVLVIIVNCGSDCCCTV